MKILSKDEDTRRIKVQCETCGTVIETTIGTYETLKNLKICPTCYKSYEAGFVKKIGTEFEITGSDFLPDKPFSRQQIQLRHLSPECNYYTRTVVPHTLSNRNDNWCPLCRKMDKGKDFNSKVYALVGDEYSVLGDYRGSKTKILMKHNVCNYEWMVRPDNFLGNKNKAGSKCPKCQKAKKSFEAHKIYARYHTS